MLKVSKTTLIFVLAIIVAVFTACGDNVKEKHTHDFGEWITVKEADCTVKGEEKRKCDCGEEESREISAKGHTFGEWETVTEPSENKEGEKSRVCEMCGYEQTEKIAKSETSDKPDEPDKPEQPDQTDEPDLPTSVTVIKTEEDLIKVTSGNRDGEYELGANITLTEKWKTAKKFSGIFDGKGYSIINMNVVSDIMSVDGDSVKYMTGMFSKNEGTIKNVNFVNFRIEITSAEINAAEYEQVKFSATETIKSLDINAGIVGQNNGTIENVTAEVNIKIIPDTQTSRVRAGGISGKNNGIIKKCVSTGKISATENGGYIRIGGIAGYASDKTYISGCESNATLSAENEGAKNNIGGIAGNVECGIFEKCFFGGNVISSDSEKAAYIGGIVGIIDNTSGKYEIMNVTVSDCYTKATLTESGVKGSVGGIIGKIESVIGENKTVTIKGCVSTSSVFGAKKRGGFLGDLSLMESAGNSVSYPVTGTYAKYFVLESNVCTSSDKYAEVKDGSNIVYPSGFVLA